MFHTSLLSKPQTLSEWRHAITENYCVEEAAYARELIQWLDLGDPSIDKITLECVAFLKTWRTNTGKNSDLTQAFLQKYGLHTREGLVLMCLAEALVRIPDASTARIFIRDIMQSANWNIHRGQSNSKLVNTVTTALHSANKFLEFHDPEQPSIFNRLIKKIGEALLQSALARGVLWLGNEFVFAPNLDKALTKVKSSTSGHGYSYSFDLLGEGALTYRVAETYRAQYLNAVKILAREQRNVKEHNNLHKKSSVDTTKIETQNYSLSIKLSALHPRYEYAQKERLIADLIGNEDIPGYLVQLAIVAKAAEIPLTIDAEEADRLELSLDIIEELLHYPQLAGWNGFGLAVQAYSKRTLPLLGYLNQLAENLAISINARLVKGAYWDSEIQWAQRAGLPGYPVFTQKPLTDIAYLASAKYLFSVKNLYPQFATHNAHTIMSILELAGTSCNFEFQRLHGMGESLYQQLFHEHPQLTCRIYAPVGKHTELLPYLVRRLLENGANTSFVNQAHTGDSALENLTEHPVRTYFRRSAVKIPLPLQLFEHPDPILSRKNSLGTNMATQSLRDPLLKAIEKYRNNKWHACPIINGEYVRAGNVVENVNPADTNKIIGTVIKATKEQAKICLDLTEIAHGNWQKTSAADRASCLEKIADLFEKNSAELISLLICEAGKITTDAVDELREAVDFCRYYAQQAREQLEPKEMPGPSGEYNELRLEGRGIFVCLSPWNFPLAIFTGQIVAALVTGNCVIAKPARQTALIAYRVIELMLAAGIPANVLSFLPGNSQELSSVLNSDRRVAG
ncbi:MAG: bifunctional proline dehydrogenase/L-glutamate gamma-semialdehyde dehydrogenase PutA, partial [Moraxellaceae bacterium]